jgi:hypothetical protein
MGFSGRIVLVLVKNIGILLGAYGFRYVDAIERIS